MFKIQNSIILLVILASAPVLAQGVPYAACGTIQQGMSCIVFVPEGTTDEYSFDPMGFSVGDEVFVEGILDTGCFSICFAIDGCIFDSTVTPCAPPFSVCGTLISGLSGCILLEDAAGETYLPEFIGTFEVGDQVLVEGDLDTGCFSFCTISVGCIFGNTIEACGPTTTPISICGVLADGLSGCVVLEGEDGETYLPENLGSFGVGDEVLIEGELDPACFSICTVSGGCIFGNTIEMCPGDDFQRGDCNADSMTDIADAIYLLDALFPSGAPVFPDCDDACDSNDDGVIDVADAIALLSSLFGSPSVPLPDPTGGCGADPTDDGISCASYTVCP